MFVIFTYLAYLGLSLFLVFVVGYLFYRNGQHYIDALLPDNKDFSKMLNKLLLILYYLLNGGFILFFLCSVSTIQTMKESIDFISKQLSFNIIIISILHYINLITLHLIAKNIFSQNKL